MYSAIPLRAVYDGLCKRPFTLGHRATSTPGFSCLLLFLFEVIRSSVFFVFFYIFKLKEGQSPGGRDCKSRAANDPAAPQREVFTQPLV